MLVYGLVAYLTVISDKLVGFSENEHPIDDAFETAYLPPAGV